MNYIYLAILIFVTYLVVYALLERICKCIEHCATERSLKRYLEVQQIVNGVVSDDVPEPENKEE